MEEEMETPTSKDNRLEHFMTTESTTNLLRSVGEALAPFLPDRGTTDETTVSDAVTEAIEEAIENIDHGEKVEEYMSYNFDPSDHDIMTEGDFDPSDHDLLTDDEISEKISEKISEAEVVTIDNILAVLADALGGLPAVEQAA